MGVKRFDLPFNADITGGQKLLPDFGKHVRVHHEEVVRVVGPLLAGTFSRYPSGLFSVTGSIRPQDDHFCVTFDFPSEELWLHFSSLLPDDIQEGLAARLITQRKRGATTTVHLERDIVILIDIGAELGELQEHAAEDYIPLVVKSVRDSRAPLIDPFSLPDPDVIVRRHKWWIQESEHLVSVWCSPSDDLRKHTKNHRTRAHALDVHRYEENLTLALSTHFVSKREPVNKMVDFLVSTNRIKKTGRKAFSLFGETQSKLSSAGAHFLKTFTEHVLSVLHWHMAVRIYDRTSIEDIRDDLRDVYDKSHSLHISLFEALRQLTRPRAPELPQDDIEGEIRENLAENRGMAAVIQRHLEKYPPEFAEHPEIKDIVPDLLLYKVIVAVVEAGRTDFASPEVYARARENIERIGGWISCCSVIESRLFVPMRTEV